MARQESKLQECLTFKGKKIIVFHTIKTSKPIILR